jgi:TPR repeat protein
MSMAEPESAPSAQAPAPERIVEAPASADLPRADAAIRPSTDLPVAESPAIPVPAIPAQAVQLESAQSEASRADPPRAETVQVITGPSATVVAESKAPSAPPPVVRAPVPVTGTIGPQDVKLLIDRGKQFFEAGDLIAARILLLRAANAGDAGAAVAMGATYDPVVLADRGYRSAAADLDKARGWYERAKEMGSPEGPRRLEMLANR